LVLVKTAHPITGKEKIKKLDSAFFPEKDANLKKRVDEVLLTPKNSRSILKISSIESPNKEHEGDFNDSSVSKNPQDFSFQAHNTFEEPKIV
jgi:hypothetical protein